MAFRYLHAADLHLDTPFDGLSVTDPKLRERLVEASLAALDELVATAIRESVSFVVLAGDIYDGADRGIRAQVRTLQATRTLDEAGIWTFIVHGNHDPVASGPASGWTAVRQWPQRVHIFAADRVEVRELVASDGTRVTVSGISYPRRDVREGLHLRFPGPEGEGFHLALLHANVGSVAAHLPYSPCRLEELVATGYDAWALGHVHTRQTLRVSAPFIAYPGNLQGRGFKPGERGAKGALVVQVDGPEVTHRFVELGPVRFEEVEVDAGPCGDLGAVVDSLQAAASRLATPGGTVLVRAVLTGRTAAYEDLAEEEPEALLTILRDGTASSVHWAGVDVRVHPVADLAQLLDRQDIQGELARGWAELRGAPPRAREALQAVDGLRGVAWTDEELAGIADEAADLAVFLLGVGA